MAQGDSLGDFIRRQRELSEMSMRQLASLAGISNPYLSQIEHGLREPSEKVLKALADQLDVSAEMLNEQARRRDDEAGESPTARAIREDRALTAGQRQALLKVYDAFRIANGKAPPRRRRAT